MTISIWLIAACIAIAIELHTGSLYLLITAIALAFGGLATWLGCSLNLSLLIASLSAIAGYSWLTYYRRNHYIERKFKFDLDIGQSVQIIKLEDNGDAVVLYRGAEWAAHLRDKTIAENVSKKAYICAHDGNTLIISLNKPA